MSTPTDDVNDTGRVFRAFFNTAWTDFQNNEFEKANEMAKWLLLQPALGRYHKAGAHLILAHSPDCYVTHAREAVRHFKDLETETKSQLEFKQRCIEWAEKVLKKAEKDAEDLANNPLTEEELDDHMRKFSDALDEHKEAMKKSQIDSEEGEEEEEEEKEEEFQKKAVTSYNPWVNFGLEVPTVDDSGSSGSSSEEAAGRHSH